METKIFHAPFFIDGQPDIVNVELYDKNENDYPLPEISCQEGCEVDIRISKLN